MVNKDILEELENLTKEDEITKKIVEELISKELHGLAQYKKVYQKLIDQYSNMLED